MFPRPEKLVSGNSSLSFPALSPAWDFPPIVRIYILSLYSILILSLYFLFAYVIFPGCRWILSFFKHTAKRVSHAWLSVEQNKMDIFTSWNCLSCGYISKQDQSMFNNTRDLSFFYRLNHSLHLGNNKFAPERRVIAAYLSRMTTFAPASGASPWPGWPSCGSCWN